MDQHHAITINLVLLTNAPAMLPQNVDDLALTDQRGAIRVLAVIELDDRTYRAQADRQCDVTLSA